jgi:ribonuclease HII
VHRIGIDEVGRGPLAGPVVVAAVALPKGMRLPKELGPLRDSKKLTKLARERWAKWIRVNLPHAVARSSATVIDARGIARCANACALRAYRRVAAEVGAPASVRLDGGLFLGSKVRQLAEHPRAQTEPRADEDHPEVALASIIAKVTRDRALARYDLTYPGYGFSEHAGYGTRAHYEALKKLGPSPVHRLTFLKSLGTMGR